MKQFLINAYNWLMKSSANPEKLSLTIKGILSAIVFVAVSFGANYTFTSFDVSAMAYDIANLISQIGVAVSALVAAFGFVRKIYITLFNK